MNDYQRGFADGYAKAEAEFLELKLLYEKHTARLVEMHAELTRMTRLIWDSEQQPDVKRPLQ